MRCSAGITWAFEALAALKFLQESFVLSAGGRFDLYAVVAFGVEICESDGEPKVWILEAQASKSSDRAGDRSLERCSHRSRRR